MANQEALLTPIAERARRRITRRLMPYLFIIYVIAFLDRANVGYARLQMDEEPWFTDQVYGLGAGIFFIGYILLEIPGGVIAEKWSARRWIARIMISWGVVAVLIGFITSAPQFYALRFLLGLAEAGFYPSVVVYLTHWFRYEDRAKTMAMFLAAIPTSNIIGAPISGLLLGVNWFGLAGWRWLFIIEGAPAIIFGIVTLFYLTDWPRQAKWLPPEEREWITAELEREKQAKQKLHSYSIWEALRRREIVLLTIGYFLIVTAGYGNGFWLPALVKQLSGLSNLEVTLITTIPSCVGLLSLQLMGWSSDRSKERRLHTAIPMMVAAAGFLLAALLQNNTALAVAMLCLVSAGVYGYQPSLWSLPAKFLTGAAAAATFGMMNSFGSLGGFLGPYVVGYLFEATHRSFTAGLIFLAISALAAGCFILALRPGRVKAPLPEGKAYTGD